MGRIKITFDKDNFNFNEVGRTAWDIVRAVLRFVVVSASLAVVYYMIVSVFISTDTERNLRQENRMYERTYPRMEQRAQLLEEEIQNLTSRDVDIYNSIFHSPAPSIVSLSDLESLSDTIPDSSIYDFINAKVDVASEKAERVEENFRAIFAAMQEDGFSMPPMDVPVENFSVERTGASLGDKINPFSKVSHFHQGLDLLSPSGAAVLCPADGVVTKVVHSHKGLGNYVEINHGNGYHTSYAHLSEISVSSKRNVKRGTRIGSVGISGNAFVPHLHYEVRRDSLYLDPLNFTFGSLDPEDWTEMLMISSNTGQSMD